MKVNFTHLVAFIWACLITFLLFLGLTGCSGQYHYAKAIKKGVRCETVSDTITLTKIDSVYINNEWVKVITEYDTIIRYNEVFVPKTRYQIKTEYKIKRDSIEVVKYKTKVEYKMQKQKFPWKMLLVCLGIGFIVALFMYKKL